MAKIQSVEPNIADLANGWLKSYKLDYKLEQESLNTEIDQALNDYYSKNGGVGGNRPDAKLLLQDKNLVNYPILIEYKGYKDKLVKLDVDGKVANKTAKNQPDFKNINSYAVNGAVHYANALLHYTSYIVRQSTENGRKGNIDEPIKYLNPGNTISFGQDTATMFYQEKPYFTGDKIKILRPKYAKFGKNNAQFFLSTMRKAFCSFAWGSSRFNVETLKKQMVSLPIKNNGYIDFDFMESFIAELEAERVAELSAYLTVSGLDNYELSNDEEDALKNFQSLKWDTYNLEKLFGKSTRGKRLKGDDRIAGTLPFVTAGEASEGISAYISNEVEVFEKNTTTIDMFGSAKYRNYIYGGDDHIAVVHTENLPKYASIFYALLWCQSVEQQRGVILLSPFRREKTFVVCQCTFDCTSEIIVQSIGCSLGIF